MTSIFGRSDAEASTSSESEGASSSTSPSSSSESATSDIPQFNGQATGSSSTADASPEVLSTSSMSFTGQSSASATGSTSSSDPLVSSSQSATSETSVSTSSAGSASSSTQPSSSNITPSITTPPASSSPSNTLEAPNTSVTSAASPNAAATSSVPTLSSILPSPPIPSSSGTRSPSPSFESAPFPDGTGSTPPPPSTFSQPGVTQISDTSIGRSSADMSASAGASVSASASASASASPSATPILTPQAAVPNIPATTFPLSATLSSSSSVTLSPTSGSTPKSQSSVSRAAIIAGATGSFGGLTLLIGLVYLLYWCRKRKKSRDSFVSTAPLWQRSEPPPRESFGNDLDLPNPTFPRRRGHSSGMDMVQVSDDPFGATSPSSPHPLGAPSIVVDTAPFDAVYGQTPSSTTRLVYHTDPVTDSPGWAQRAFPAIPAIRIQSASTNDYAEAEHRSSYAESMVPLETPDDNFPNPFSDPVDYAVSRNTSTSSVNVPPSPQSTQSGSVIKTSSQARLPSRSNSRLTMDSFRAEVVPSPVDSIDRFWDIPTPSPYPSSSQLSAPSPSSSESLLRSVSPGPGPTTPRLYSYAL